jgi:plasmid stability protein
MGWGQFLCRFVLTSRHVPFFWQGGNYMVVTITLIDETLVEQLRVNAEKQHISIEETTLRILRDALKFGNQDELTPEDVVAKIQAMPSNPARIHPATGSLAEALPNASDFPEFDLDAYQKEWTAVEREMKTIIHTNAIAEGHR